MDLGTTGRALSSYGSTLDRRAVPQRLGLRWCLPWWSLLRVRRASEPSRPHRMLIALEMSGSARPGNTPPRARAPCARPLGLAAAVRWRAPAGRNSNWRRPQCPVTGAARGTDLGQHDYAARSQSSHGEPGRPIDHFDGGPDLTGGLVPFASAATLRLRGRGRPIG